MTRVQPDADAPLSLESAAIVVAGRDGVITWASQAVHDLLKHHPESLVGGSIEALVPPEFLARHRAGWKRTWRANRLPPPASPIMIPVMCGDGEVRRFASHLLPVNAPHGQLLAVAAVWVPRSEADVGLRDLI